MADTDPRARLAEIKARIDLPAMAAALTEVLDLHAIEDGKGIFCGDCRACAYPHPCPTVRAITDALGGDRG